MVTQPSNEELRTVAIVGHIAVGVLIAVYIVGIGVTRSPWWSKDDDN